MSLAKFSSWVKTVLISNSNPNPNPKHAIVTAPTAQRQEKDQSRVGNTDEDDDGEDELLMTAQETLCDVGKGQGQGKLELELRAAFEPGHEIVARGAANTPSGYRDIYECLMTYDPGAGAGTSAKPRGKRRRIKNTSTGTGTRRTKRHLRDAVWVIARSEKIEENLAHPPKDFLSCEYKPEVVPGLSVAEDTPWQFNPNDRTFFDALVMHVRPAILVYSPATPGLAVAFCADKIWKAASDGSSRKQLVRLLLKRFAIAVNNSDVAAQLELGLADNADDEAHPLRRFVAEDCDRAKRRTGNFDLKGRAMVRVGNTYEIYYARKTRTGEKTWEREDMVNPNLSEAFKIWSLHRVGLDRPHHSATCGLSTVYLKPHSILSKTDNDGKNSTSFSSACHEYDLLLHRKIHNLRRADEGRDSANDDEDDDEDDEHNRMSYCPALKMKYWKRSM